MSQAAVETRTSRVRLDPDGVVLVTILPGVEETLGDAQATAQGVASVSGGRRAPLLVDMRDMRSQSREARHFYGGAEVAPLVSGVALLVDSRVSVLLANFFITVTRTLTPTKMFTDEAAARAWLLGLRP